MRPDAPAPTRGQRAAQAELVEAMLARRPLVLLEGEAGIGKTLVLDATCAELRRNGLPVTRLAGAGLRPAALLERLGVGQAALAAVGRDGSGTPAERLPELVGEQVLVVDDARLLPAETLALLAALLRLRADGGRVLQVVLSGATGLLRRLGMEVPELRERAGTAIGIAPMPSDEAAAFLAGRLQALRPGGVAALPVRTARALLLHAAGVPARLDAELARILAPAPSLADSPPVFSSPVFSSPVFSPAQPAPPAAPRRLPDSLRPVPHAPKGGMARRRWPGGVAGVAALGFAAGMVVMGGAVWLAWPASDAVSPGLTLSPWAAALPSPGTASLPGTGAPPLAAGAEAGDPATHPAPAMAPPPGPSVTPGGHDVAGRQAQSPASPALASPFSARPAQASASLQPHTAPDVWWAALPPPATPHDEDLEQDLARAALATSMERGTAPSPAPEVPQAPMTVQAPEAPLASEVLQTPLAPMVPQAPLAPEAPAATAMLLPPVAPSPSVPAVAALPVAPPAVREAARPHAAIERFGSVERPGAVPSPQDLTQRPLPDGDRGRSLPDEGRGVPSEPPRSSYAALRPWPRVAMVPHQVLPGGEAVGALLLHSVGRDDERARALFAALNPGRDATGNLPGGIVVLLPVRGRGTREPREAREIRVPRAEVPSAPSEPSARPYFCDHIRPVNAAELAYATQVCSR